MNPSSVRSVVASDGYRLHFRYWPARVPRGLVIATHGIQSHSDWYRHSSAALAQAGFEVYFADRRGSGLNSECRGHADHGERLINDLRQLIGLARREHAPSAESGCRPLPLTLMGISWGGKIAAATAAVLPAEVNQLVLLYPGLKPRIRPSSWQLLQLKTARLFDIRHKPVAIPLEDPALFTSSIEWQQYIRDDQLALHTVTSGLLNAGRDLDEFIADHSSEIIQPTLLLLAGHDSIIDNRATRAAVTEFGSTHQTTIVYPEARHTLEFETVRDQSVADLLHWMTDSALRRE